MEDTVARTRSLASLTPEECQAIYAVAFGYAPPLDQLFTLSVIGPLTIADQVNSLILYENGSILAKHQDGAAYFNAWKVIKLLESYSVTLGEP